MKRLNHKITKGLKYSALVILFFVAIGFTQRKQNQRVCREIHIDIDDYYDHYFLNEEDVMFLISEGGKHQIMGTLLNELDLKNIESRVKTHKFIKDVQVFKDLKGNLITRVQQRRPIARIIPQQGIHAYISSHGKILPISDRFTARVVLVGGGFAQELLKNDLSETYRGRDLLELLKFIDEDEFWRAQIAQVNIDWDGNIILIPQVGKQYVEFGKLENTAFKFKKLKVFYTKILPSQGWNKYRKVNLNYKNQIICE